MDWSLILQYKTWMYSILSTSMGFLRWKNIGLTTKTSHLCLLEAEILQNSCFRAAILKSKMAAAKVVQSRVSCSYIKEHTKYYQCANFHTFFTKWTISLKSWPNLLHYLWSSRLSFKPTASFACDRFTALRLLSAACNQQQSVFVCNRWSSLSQNGRKFWHARPILLWLSVVMAYM